MILIILTLLAVMATACTRRPAQKDLLVGGNSMGRTTTGRIQINSSPGAAQAPNELQFIDTMIQLQLIAIEAEQLVATRAQHVELKQLTKAMVVDQQAEIASLRQLRAARFGDAAQAVNADLPGARESTQEIDLEKLDLLKENAFDVEFIRQLTPLYESIVAMPKGLLNEGLHPELKQLADDHADQQAARVEQMRKWSMEWEKS